jgi:hypothetical protein
MGMLSGWIEQLVVARCRRDASGRLVFLPNGKRREGFYLDSTPDYQKVKALIGIYSLASILFQVLGSTSAVVVALGASDSHPGSLVGRLEFGLVVYVISAFTLQWLPMLLLWRLYRALLPELCSSLQEVSPESMGKLQTIPNPMPRRGLIVAFAGLLVMAVIIFLVSRPRYTNARPGPTTHTQH